MNLPIFIRVNNFINLKSLAILLVLIATQIAQAWEIDLSRRRKDLRREEARTITSAGPETDFISKYFPIEPKQEIVILNTENGFIPNTVRLRSGAKYTFHVVNVNEKKKNVSFIMDSFGEHHGTFYGKVKTFTIQPEKEGMFSYQCPEKSIEGLVVVYKGKDNLPKPDIKQLPQATPTTNLRDLASE